MMRGPTSRLSEDFEAAKAELKQEMLAVGVQRPDGQLLWACICAIPIFVALYLVFDAMGYTKASYACLIILVGIVPLLCAFQKSKRFKRNLRTSIKDA